MSEPYSHRNGETEPPTVPGTYWFTGFIDETWRHDGGFQTEGDGEAVRFDGDCAWFQGDQSGYRPEYCKGQWWGPVTPPWEPKP